MDHQNEDGATRRETAQSIFGQTGKWPEDYPEGPPFPDALHYLWGWFVVLSAGRGSSGFGPNPLSWSDFDAWSRLMRVVPDMWEVTALRELDVTYLSSLATPKEKK